MVALTLLTQKLVDMEAMVLHERQERINSEAMAEAARVERETKAEELRLSAHKELMSHLAGQTNLIALGSMAIETESAVFVNPNSKQARCFAMCKTPFEHTKHSCTLSKGLCMARKASQRFQFYDFNKTHLPGCTSYEDPSTFYAILKSRCPDSPEFFDPSLDGSNVTLKRVRAQDPNILQLIAEKTELPSPPPQKKRKGTLLQLQKAPPAVQQLPAVDTSTTAPTEDEEELNRDLIPPKKVQLINYAECEERPWDYREFTKRKFIEKKKTMKNYFGAV